MTLESPPEALYEFSAGPYEARELQVVSFRGVEGCSEPFAWDLVLATEQADDEALEAELLGAHGRFTMNLPGGRPRVIEGVIDRVHSDEAYLPHQLHRCRVRIVPRLALLKHRVNTRIFQDKSLPEIVEAVLRTARIECSWHLSGRYPRRPYTVQYRESDLDFVHRMLAQEGIFYWFEPQTTASKGAGGEWTESLVLADSARAYAAVPGESTLHLRSREGMVAVGEHVVEFSLRRKVGTGALRLHDYDFRRPRADVSATAEISPQNLALEERGFEVYEHHGEHEEPDVTPARAKTNLEQLRARARVGVGRSFCGRLSPGAWFALEDHSVARLNQRWTVVRVTHQGEQPEVLALLHRNLPPEKVGRSYENQFQAVPHEVPYRPQRIERQVVQVVETATVVGPASEEIYTDEFGRIKVQFHWDREGKRNEHASCWIRVAQTWAGNGWGFQFIPRIGMEVLVTFLGGDQDRPMVTGCVFNQEHPPPFALPENKSISGIRTSSTPGGKGNNELSFEDAAGQERVYFHAQKDHDSVVENDRTRVVHRDETLRVDHDRTRSVGGMESVTVEQDQIVTVENDHVRTVMGNEVVTVFKNLVIHVVGSQIIHVDGQGLEPPKPPPEKAQEPSPGASPGGRAIEAVQDEGPDVLVKAPFVEPGAEGAEILRREAIDRGGGRGQGGGGGVTDWSNKDDKNQGSVLTIAKGGTIDSPDGLTLKGGGGSITIVGGVMTLKATTINLEADAINLNGKNTTVSGGPIKLN